MLRKLALTSCCRSDESLRLHCEFDISVGAPHADHIRDAIFNNVYCTAIVRNLGSKQIIVLLSFNTVLYCIVLYCQCRPLRHDISRDPSWCQSRKKNLTFMSLPTWPVIFFTYRLQKKKVKVKAVYSSQSKAPHRYGSLHVIWDHTELPATRQRQRLPPLPRPNRPVLDLSTN